MLALQKLGLTLTALSAVALLTSPTHAQTTTSIPVNNNGFELDTVNGTNGTNPNTPIGWTYNGTHTGDSGYAVGVQNVVIAGETGNQYGFDFAEAGGYDLEQNTGFTTTVGDTYTLSADIFTNNGAYAQIKVTDGNGSHLGTVVQSTSAFTTQSVTFIALPGTSASPLIIDLLLTDSSGVTTTASHSGQACFDNVQLTQIAPVAAPEPAAWVGLAVGALGLGALSLRARRRTLCA